MSTATATAHPNIALVKYWGKRDIPLNLPAVPSLSLTLDGFLTTTTVRWGADVDGVFVDGAAAEPRFAGRALTFLDRLDPDRPACRIDTSNNFPAGAGLASSASGFAALAVAGSAAAGHDRTLAELSALARQGSGSACRSLFGGFVEWPLGTRADGRDSHGVPVLASEAWDVAMVVGVVASKDKGIGSTEAMERSRRTSPNYDTWVRCGPADVDEARLAVRARDLPRLGAVMEASTLRMHAVMHTSVPAVVYWLPGTVACLHAIWNLRAGGTGAWTTMDAGPNVKVLCRPADAQAVRASMEPHVEAVHVLAPGPPAQLVTS